MEKDFGTDYVLGEVVSLRNEPGYRIEYLGVKDVALTRPVHAFKAVDGCDGYTRDYEDQRLILFYIKPYCYKVKEETT